MSVVCGEFWRRNHPEAQAPRHLFPMGGLKEVRSAVWPTKLCNHQAHHCGEIGFSRAQSTGPPNISRPSFSLHADHGPLTAFPKNICQPRPARLHVLVQYVCRLLDPSYSSSTNRDADVTAAIPRVTAQDSLCQAASFAKRAKNGFSHTKDRTAACSMTPPSLPLLARQWPRGRELRAIKLITLQPK